VLNLVEIGGLPRESLRIGHDMILNPHHALLGLMKSRTGKECKAEILRQERIQETPNRAH
jgi:hypothetical protein